MKIVVDIFGGDHSPNEIVKGAVEALSYDKELSLVLAGQEQPIKGELSKYRFDASKIEVVNATEVITNNESPTSAIKQKKDSSLVRSLELLKNDESISAMVSAGSTGAVLAGGIFKVGRIKGINRPALAPLLPTVNGKEVTVVDTGANVDCRPEFLAQFALMGSVYMKSCGVENPRVALVSVGVEDKKGNELTHQAFELLKNLPINFVGNMEARDALSGEYEVLVCDGFVGNVLVKSVEGTAGLVMKKLKDAIMSSTSAKIGYSLFMKKAFGRLKEDMNYNAKGGAPLLGIEKVIVKSHGSSKALAIRASILKAANLCRSGLVENIKSGLAALQSETKSE